MRNLASTVVMLAALLLAACAQGMAGTPAAPHGPPYDSGDKDGGGGGGGSGM
jgi:Spy/CpxP family protein refolding chaperone